jgi:acetolactate synthase regulatory subunit
MYVILRLLDRGWSVAVEDVEAEALERALSMWRARGYSVLSVRSS